MKLSAGRLGIVLGSVLIIGGCGCRKSSSSGVESSAGPGEQTAEVGLNGRSLVKKRPMSERPTFADPEAPTEAEMDALARFLVPYVEEAAGARFVRVPRGRLGTPENLSEDMAIESRTIMSKIYDLPPSVLERMSRPGGSIFGIAGKYMTSTGDVYVVPHSIVALGMSLPDAGEQGARDVATIIMVHELGHALQDQVGDLDRVFDALQDVDHFDGMRGITEGHANWVTLRVARATGLEDAFWAMSASQGWGPDGLQQPGAFDTWMLYGLGMEFCEHHAELGGSDRLWDLIKEPPRSTTMLFRPDQYGDNRAPETSLRGVFSGVELALTGSSDWIVADSQLGEAPLRREALGLDDDAVDGALGGMDWGFERRMFISPGSSVSPRSASVIVLEFETPDKAQALVTLLSDGMEAQSAARTQLEAERMKDVPGARPRRWEVAARPYDRIDGDVVLRRVAGPLSENGARLTRDEQQSLWVVRGDQVVALTVSGFRPGNRLDKAVELTFAKLAAVAEAAEAP